MLTVPLIIEPEPDDPGFAAVLVDGSIAGRPRRFLLDTAAARSQVETDAQTQVLPVTGQHTSSAVFSAGTSPVVTVHDLRAGDLHVPELAVTRADPVPGQARNLLGVDVLRPHRCHFRFSAAALDLDGPTGPGTGLSLDTEPTGHFFVELSWAGVTGRGCWDTGASATVVDQGFWQAHPDLFTAAGTSAGTDATGASAASALLRMAPPVIGGRAFAGHPVVAVDLGRIRAASGAAVDFILGYPTLGQADWLFDFPAGRWWLTG
jgi:hypothetical protein